MISFPYDYESEHAEEIEEDIYAFFDEINGLLAETQPKGITQMSTPINTESMSFDEVARSVQNGDLNIDEVKLTDAQRAEAESTMTVSVAELRGALSAIFGDDNDPDIDPADAVDTMVIGIVSIIHEHREMEAFFDMILGGPDLNEGDLKRIFGE